jgi:hypothetical protein
MRINEKMNLVIPLYHGDGDPYAWVHSTPITREVFDSNFLLLSKTFASIFGEGLGEIAGPRVSHNLMKRIASNMGAEGERSYNALMNEIRRLTNVLHAHDGGWDVIPLQNALSMKILDEEDVPEVENAITFFIVNSAMHRSQMLRAMLPGAVELWGAQITSSTVSDYRKSLPISNVIDSFGEKAEVSSVLS